MPKKKQTQKLPWNFSITAQDVGIWPLKKIIRVCRFAGLSGIEWTAKLCAGKTNAELSEFRRAFSAANLKIDSFHLPFDHGDDASSFYETIRRGTVDRYSRIMEQAARLGCRVVIMHPTTIRYSTTLEGFDRFLGQLAKSLKTLLPQAAKLRLKIALENLLPDEAGGRFGSQLKDFEQFRREFDDPAFGFCLDCGHALISGGISGPAAFFDVMAPKLIAFHLQDNAGDRDTHLAPGHGLVDWHSVFGRMHRLGFKHTACIEASPFAPGPHMTHPPAAWRKMVDETTLLALKAAT